MLALLQMVTINSYSTVSVTAAIEELGCAVLVAPAGSTVVAGATIDEETTWALGPLTIVTMLGGELATTEVATEVDEGSRTTVVAPWLTVTVFGSAAKLEMIPVAPGWI
jgi:hypothetical protein